MSDLPTDEARRALDACLEAEIAWTAKYGKMTLHQLTDRLEALEAENERLREQNRILDIMGETGFDRMMAAGEERDRLAAELASLRDKTAGGAGEMRERAAHLCEVEAGLCVADIVAGDEAGSRLAHERASALLTAADDIRLLPLDQSPQGEGGGE